MFTSFYDYQMAPYLIGLDDIGIWVSRRREDDGGYSLWRHHAGEYCEFFGKSSPYSMTLICNPEPQADKTFTNLEFRACVDGDGEDNSASTFSGVFDHTFISRGRGYRPYLPFDSLETWNEYQHGIAVLQHRWGHSVSLHHGSDGISSLRRKFRIWRCDIPRDNASTLGPEVFDSSFDATFQPSVRRAHPLDRMRNPWLYLRLSKRADTGRRTEIHDLLATYFV